MPAPTREKVSFPGGEGETLAAWLDRPAGKPLAFAVFAHCFACTKDSTVAHRISGRLAERGVAVLRFDFTGLGESEGEFGRTTFGGNVADIVAAADFLRRAYAAPRLLVGHSLGGAAVLAAAPAIPEAKAVATIAAPADAAHIAKYIRGGESEGEPSYVELKGRRFPIGRRFLEELGEHRLEQAIAGLGRALMVFHGPRDEIVGIEHASRIFLAAKHPKSFVSLDDADHLLSRAEDASFWRA